MTDLYGALEVPRHLAIDLKDLEKRYYALSRKLHPDLFARKPQAERDAADAAMAVLNDAWRTLRDPIARALYVLKQEGLDVSEQGTKDVPPELLEEVFELNMALEEGGAERDAARQRFEKMRDEIDAQLNDKFKEFDAGQTALLDIRGLLNRRKYITNLIAKAQATNHVSD